MPTSTNGPSRVARWATLGVGLSLGLLLGGCGPSPREVQNRREFEALLSAVSLKNRSELELDAGRIAARHRAGELSDAGFADLSAVIEPARAGDWAEAERRAYALRKERPYFR